MRKKRVLIFFMGILFNFFLAAQPNQALEKHYLRGSEGFFNDIGNAINYSKPTAIGTAIISWSVSSQGIFNITLINALDPQLNEELIKAVQSTQPNWDHLQQDTCTFYLPVRFKPNNLDFEVKDFPDHYLKGLTLVSHQDTDRPSDKKLNKMLEKQWKRYDYHQALVILKSLIQRDPFNLSYREKQIQAMNYVGLYDTACDELKFCQEMLFMDLKIECELE
jgi:hypothetical protein